MINGKKVGVGIVTYNRPVGFMKCFDSIKDNTDVDHIVVVNDGLGHACHHTIQDKCHYILNPHNLGVGKSKNKAIKYLQEHDCDYIFLIEDDILVKDPTVFQKYIEASDKTGIQHFNYSQHGMMNKSWPGGTPNPRTTLSYDAGQLPIPLYMHCVGAFSFYTRLCLETVGLLDERYYNACEHVDHTLEVIKKGMHPPFWFFADIDKSWEYLGDEEWSMNQSTISGKPGHDNIVSFADEIFRMKHGCTPGQIQDTPFEVLPQYLKQIKKAYVV